MTKIYFAAPLIALLVFGGAYWFSQKDHAAREHTALVAQKAAQETARRAEIEARNIAIAEQLRLQEIRKKERAEKDAREKAERDQRETALAARDTAFHDQEKIARQIERLKRETAVEQEAITKLQADKTAALAEQFFLKTFVREAQDNLAALQDVLVKIAAAESARVKQAAEAAAKAKS